MTLKFHFKALVEIKLALHVNLESQKLSQNGH